MYEILTGCPLFRGMTGTQIEELFSTSDNYSVAEFKKGSVIARRDSAYSGLMIILRGVAGGEMIDSAGHKVTIDALEAPQLIAPAFLFGGYNRLPIDVIAQTDVQILTLHRALLFEFMQENMVVLSNFIDIISDRANVWSKRIFFQSFKSLKEKLASYLLENSNTQHDSAPMPDITMTAEYFGATRSSLMAVIEGLEKKHIIARNGDTINILNREALKDTIK